MIDEQIFKKITLGAIIAIIVILSFLILQPILLSVIFALILSFIFYPLYRWINKKIKKPSLSAFLICALLLIIVIVPLIFIVPFLVRQIFEIYLHAQGIDLVAPLKAIFPKLFSSPAIANTISTSLNSFTHSSASYLLDGFTDILVNTPTILLHLLLILFVFFFGLRDGEKLIEYLQVISPFSKESEKKIMKRFGDITKSVLFGQFVVGIAQGIVTGIAFFVFSVPNALTLTLIATFIGILPIIGPWLVWIPVDLYLVLSGRPFAALGLLIYGAVVITWIDTLIRPVIVSKKTKINSAVILVSMIGGLFVFGVLGLILGPLIIGYLILLLEFYKSKRYPSLLESEKE